MEIILYDSGQDLYHIFNKLCAILLLNAYITIIVLTHLNITNLVLFIPCGA